MPFIPISPAEIAVGEPVSNASQTKIRENFDNHEARILGVETGASTVYPPLVFRVNGFYGTMGAYSRVVETTANFDMTITGIRLLIDEAGSSGTTEINILRKRGAGAPVSLLTTRPSLTSAAGNDSISTNGVLNVDNVSILAGDRIRLDFTSTQAGNAKGLLVRIDYNKTS
jgi:hypothetical protein